MAWIMWFTTAVFLVSCNLVSPKSDGKGDSPDQKIVGYWFPCKFSESKLNTECDLVDDDGLAFTEDSLAFRIDGAGAYAKTILKDTNSGSNFNINAESLYFFDEPESFYGTYSIKGDSLYTEGYYMENDVKVETKDTFNMDLENNILTLSIDSVIAGVFRYRKYEGDAHLVSKEEWMELLNEERSD